MLPPQPKCSCLECWTYNVVYSSIMDAHKCVECKSTIKNKYVENIITGFELYKSKSSPVIIPKYNSITCIGCLRCGGISFKEVLYGECVCSLCSCSVRIPLLEDFIVNAYRTKLIEKTHHTKYSVFSTGENKNG